MPNATKWPEGSTAKMEWMERAASRARRSIAALCGGGRTARNPPVVCETRATYLLAVRASLTRASAATSWASARRFCLWRRVSFGGLGGGGGGGGGGGRGGGGEEVGGAALYQGSHSMCRCPKEPRLTPGSEQFGKT